MIFNLSNDQIKEIRQLKNELLKHIEKYSCFKNFTTTAKNGVLIANALLKNDYQAFKRFKLIYTNHHAQKMRGFYSLSTYKKASNICKFLSKQSNNCICKYCYAEKSLSLYETTLKPTLIYNTLLLKYIDLTSEQIPYINEKYFRFEAFSDLQSSKHLANLIKVCKKNKTTLFTLWTKAGYLLEKMLKQENVKLTNNLNIVISELFINKPTSKEYLTGLQNALNIKNNLKCFVVYDNEKARAESGFYQCKKSCINCLKCYKKSKEIIYIAEALRK